MPNRIIEPQTNRSPTAVEARPSMLPFLKHLHIPAGVGVVEWKAGLETAINSIAMLGNSPEEDLAIVVAEDKNAATTYLSSLWLSQSWPEPFRFKVALLLDRNETMRFRYASKEAAIIAIGGVQNHPAPEKK